MADSNSFKVGDWLVEPNLGRIARNSESVALRPQVMDLLVHLAEKDGHVAGTEELLESLWAGKYVTEGTLYNCVGELRHALGDDQEYVKTIPRKGYRLVAPVSGAESEKHARAIPGRSRAVPITAALSVILVAAAIFAWSKLSDDGLDGASKSFNPPENSIAVLPLNDLSPGSENQYLGDGIAEALIHQLAQVPEMTVIARTSSFSFRGKETDVQTIGRALNVGLLLEGSVQVESGRLRIFAQLIDTRSGAHVWSRKLDRDATGLFSLQDEIAVAVANQVTGSSIATQDLAYSVVSSPDPVAYELYIQGLYQLNTLFAPGQPNTNMSAPDNALEFFRRATEVDADFALAWAARARALNLLFQMEKVSQAEAGPMIGAFISKALQLGPGLAEVQYSAGLLSRGEDSLSYIDRAIEINPNYSAAHVGRAGILLRTGQYRDAFDAMATAAQLDPLNGMAVEGALYGLFYQGKWADIEERIEVANRLWPDANGLATEAHLMFEMGRFERFPELQRRADTIPGFGVSDWYASVPRHFGDTYLTLGLPDLARQWMTDAEMVARYDDVILMSEGKYEEAMDFLRSQIDTSRDRAPYAYRWYPDIVASLVEIYLYQGRNDELVAFFDGLGWSPGLFPLPNCCLTNPQWPEVAYAFALFETDRDEQAQQWLAALIEQMEHRLDQGIRVPNHYYELARMRVMEGRIADAYSALETAIDLGWRRWYFELDPILEPVRQLPEFAVLKAKYDADIERMRELVAAEVAKSHVAENQDRTYGR